MIRVRDGVIVNMVFRQAESLVILLCYKHSRLGLTACRLAVAFFIIVSTAADLFVRVVGKTVRKLSVTAPQLMHLSTCEVRELVGNLPVVNVLLHAKLVCDLTRKKLLRGDAN